MCTLLCTGGFWTCIWSLSVAASCSSLLQADGVQVCGIRTLLPGAVLGWLIRKTCPWLDARLSPFLPCIGSVPFLLRKASRADLR